MAKVRKYSAPASATLATVGYEAELLQMYDPCCGSSGMFVQLVEFFCAHAGGNSNGGKAQGDISIYGQESNHTTWRLAKVDSAIRGIDALIGYGDTFQDDRHPDLKADFMLAFGT